MAGTNSQTPCPPKQVEDRAKKHEHEPSDGVIECLKRGKRPKASRYWWNGTVASPSPGRLA